MAEPTQDADGSLRILKILSIGFAVFTVLLTIVFFSWWAMKDRLVFGEEKFDRVKWVTALPTTDEPCYRGAMAYDLKQRVLARGTPRGPIEALLGRPDWEDATQTEYDLGQCLWDTHGLRLYFNDQDRLIYTRIVQH